MSELPTPLTRLARGWRVFCTAWLVVLSVIALRDHGALIRSKPALTQSEATRSDVSVIQGRMAGVERAVDTIKQQPPPATAGALEATRTSLEARLTALEDRVSDAASEEELTAAKARLASIEERQSLHPLQSLSAPPPVHRASAVVAATDPPFKVLGVEWRGGERFLALAPRDASPSDAVRVLRIGDRVTDVAGDWQLQALEDKAAIFVSQGRPQRISIP